MFEKTHREEFWLHVAPTVATISKVASLFVLGALRLVVSPHYPGGLASLLVSREQTSFTWPASQDPSLVSQKKSCS